MATSEKSWIETGEKFVNPYNFVRLGEGVTRKSAGEYTGNLTGKIHCVLETKTPLAIPDSENVVGGKNEHKTYQFYRVDGKPIIPGSQIRGIIRSAYETLSNSCLSVNNVNILSSRSSAVRNAGIVQYKEGKYHLYAARKRRDKGQKFDKETDVIRIWYDSQKKHFQNFIFSITTDEIECDNLKEAIDDYRENVKIYMDMSDSFVKKIKDEGKDGFLNIRPDGLMYPVFFETVSSADGKNLVYLSPSQIGRSVYSNRVNDLLKTYRSCMYEEDEKICKACSLFGVIKNNKKAYASKIRFSDAVISGVFSSKRNITLKELSSPKITAVEFYSSRPTDAKAWTYDYKTTDYEKRKIGGKQSCLPVRELCDVKLNGRKYYLHNPNLNKMDYSTIEKTNRNSTMELCEAGNRFEFDIYFEKISEEELKEIVWTLTIGENSLESKQMYKIGHGKPLGLGSVKIIVDSVETRTFNIDTYQYITKLYDVDKMLENNPFDAESQYFKDFMTVTNFETAKEKISYPIGDDCSNRKNSKASHQWFIANRSIKGTSTAWHISRVLPKLNAKNLSLPAYEKSGKKADEKYKKSNKNSESHSFGESLSFSGIQIKKRK